MPKILLYAMDENNYTLLPNDAINRGDLVYTATNCEDAMIALMDQVSLNYEYSPDRLEEYNEVLTEEYIAAVECSIQSGRENADNDHSQAREFCEVGRRIMKEDNGKVALFGVWI